MSSVLAAAWLILCALLIGEVLHLDLRNRRVRRGRWSGWGAGCLALALGGVATLPLDLTLQEIGAALEGALR